MGPQEVKIRIAHRREVAALLVDGPGGLVAHSKRRARAADYVHQSHLFDLHVVHPDLALYTFENTEVQFDAVGIPTVEGGGHLSPAGGGSRGRRFERAQVASIGRERLDAEQRIRRGVFRSYPCTDAIAAVRRDTNLFAPLVRCLPWSSPKFSIRREALPEWETFVSTKVFFPARPVFRMP